MVSNAVPDYTELKWLEGLQYDSVYWLSYVVYQVLYLIPSEEVSYIQQVPVKAKKLFHHR